jgi:hypothetical protein
MLKEVKDAMAKFTAQADSLPKAELLRAVYDMGVHTYGKDAVGEFEEYVPRPKGYWTLERCKESALRFKTRKEWKKGDCWAYDASVRNKWQEECCAHMEYASTPAGYWTLELCKESALRFKTRTRWIDGDSPAYRAAIARGWQDECCAHMEYAQNPSGYWTLERCKESALRFKTRTEWQKGDVSANSTAQRNGWLDECCVHMESTQKPNGYWTLERCKESASRFKTRAEWQKGNGAAYNAARKKGWQDECCAHMEYTQKPSGYWTLERCKKSALRFKTKIDWKEVEISAYDAAYRRGWLEECCAHMESICKPNGYWTLELCKESALRFKTKGEWRKGETAAHSAAYVNGWLDECCAHMESIYKPSGYWTLERCKESASRFKARAEWRKGDVSAYSTAHRSGWLDECCAHMEYAQKPNGYWTLERCKESALAFSARTEWYRGAGSAYGAAKRNGWLDECCSHMVKARKPKDSTQCAD